MGNVISFQKARKKKEENFNQSKKNTQTATEKATKEYPAVLDPLKDGSSADTDYANMEPEEKIEYWKKIEKGKMDMLIHYPEELADHESDIRENIRKIMNRNHLEVEYLAVEQGKVPIKVSAAFPKIFERRNSVNVTA